MEFLNLDFSDPSLWIGFLTLTLLEIVLGIDNVVFASDTPFEPSPGLYIRETIKVIEGLGLTADEKDRIYCRNAERLLNITVAK